jgi:hypothetical protein
MASHDLLKETYSLHSNLNYKSFYIFKVHLFAMYMLYMSKYLAKSSVLERRVGAAKRQGKKGSLCMALTIPLLDEAIGTHFSTLSFLLFSILWAAYAAGQACPDSTGAVHRDH